MSLLGCLLLCAPPVLTYSTAAAFVDALNSVASRLLAASTATCAQDCAQVSPARVLAVVFLLKVPSIAGYLYFQQLAVGFGLMTVGALLPAMNLMASVSVGMAAFGDEVYLADRVAAFGSLGMYIAGVAMLSAPSKAGAALSDDAAGAARRKR